MEEKLKALLAQGMATPGPIVVLTGAGISAESGIPTFRGEEGYWRVGSNNYHPQEMATRAAFGRMPEEVWRWYLYRRGVCRAAEPNACHLDLVRLEQALKERFLLVTQNVDGLHLRAGSSPGRMYEIHGNIDFMRCDSLWGHSDPGWGARKAPRPVPIPASVPLQWSKDRHLDDATRAALSICPHPVDGSTDEGPRLSRPHVLFFDESYDESLFRFNSSLEAASKASILFVIGTSGSTNLPSQMAEVVAQRGAIMIVINRDESPFSMLAQRYDGGYFAQGLAGEKLGPMVDELCRIQTRTQTGGEG